MQHLGVYILNGLSPSPQVEMKFDSQKENPTNGRDFCYNASGSCAGRRHKEFKAFFAVQDPVKPTPRRKTHPNWKIQVLLRYAIIVNKDAIFLGRRLSCDEETMGCKGRHPDILRINAKKEGDGFQCNALGSDGYTYSFSLCNQPSPQTYLDKDVCPLLARVVALLDQVVSKNHNIGIDNLYISAKFVRFGWRHPDRFMFHGVA